MYINLRTVDLAIILVDSSTLWIQFASASFTKIGSFGTPYCLPFANCINKHFVHQKKKKNKHAIYDIPYLVTKRSG